MAKIKLKLTQADYTVLLGILLGLKLRGELTGEFAKVFERLRTQGDPQLK